MIELVPQRVGTLVLHERPPEVRRGDRSYAHDGRCLEYAAAPGFELAGDVEALDAPAAPYVAARTRLDLPVFLALWTRLEVVAKLLRVPAAMLLAGVLRGEGLPRPAGLAVRSVVGDGVVVSVGWRRLDE